MLASSSSRSQALTRPVASLSTARQHARGTGGIVSPAGAGSSLGGLL
jgi:hypothetical protein